MRPDPASELVVAYLRVNGYFIMTDLELHVLEDGSYRTLTDVDIVAVRHPNLRGPTHYQDGRVGPGVVECLLTTDVDPGFNIATDQFDVVIGEVKRGTATFNPALRDPRVLHAVARRVGDIFGVPTDQMIEDLASTGRAQTDTSQVRLVAFGSDGEVADGTTVHHGQIVQWLNDMLSRHSELIEVTTFSDPVLGLLSLAGKVGWPLAAPPHD
jgi:hypothetical protein